MAVQPPEEEAEEEDPRWELVRQLVEYKKFKDAAAAPRPARSGAGEPLRPPAGSGGARAPERPLGEVSVFDLINAFNTILKRINKKEDLREIFEENYTVSDKIDLMLKMTVERCAAEIHRALRQCGVARARSW